MDLTPPPPPINPLFFFHPLFSSHTLNLVLSLSSVGLGIDVALPVTLSWAGVFVAECCPRLQGWFVVLHSSVDMGQFVLAMYPFYSVRMLQQLFFFSWIRGARSLPTYFKTQCGELLEVNSAGKILAYRRVRTTVLEARILQSKYSSTELPGAAIHPLIKYAKRIYKKLGIKQH